MSEHLKHIETLERSVNTLERQLLDLDYETEDIPPENCSCHLHAPCADCTAYGEARARCEKRRTAVHAATEAVAELRAMLTKGRPAR